MPLKDWRQNPNGGNWVDKEGQHWTGDEPDFPGYTTGPTSKYGQYPADAKQNKFTGEYVDSEGNRWFADEPELQVGGANNWAQRPESDEAKQNVFDGLYYGQDGKQYFWDQKRDGVDIEVGGVNTNGMS